MSSNKKTTYSKRVLVYTILVMLRHFFLFCNIFFYIQLAFAFYLLRDFHIPHHQTVAFWKEFDILFNPFSVVFLCYINKT